MTPTKLGKFWNQKNSFNWGFSFPFIIAFFTFDCKSPHKALKKMSDLHAILSRVFFKRSGCTSGSTLDSPHINAESKSYLIDVTLSASHPMIPLPHNKSISSWKILLKKTVAIFYPICEVALK